VGSIGNKRGYYKRLEPGKKRGSNGYGIRHFFKRNIWIITRSAAIYYASYIKWTASSSISNIKIPLSDFHIWGQKEHAEEWMLFADNIGPYLVPFSKSHISV
jgi:hypothetical protein